MARTQPARPYKTLGIDTMTPTQNDAHLIEDLRAILDSVALIRRGLFHPRRAGCACDGPALCSLHASIYNRLGAVADELARAIHDAGSE